MNFDTNTILIAFGLTLFAGLSTGIGSLIALTCKRTNTRFLSVALGFSALVLATINVVGGYLVTDRMLGMFRSKQAPKKISDDGE